MRELWEESGLVAGGPSNPAHAMRARYVPDPRASREAWAVTVPVHVDLGTVQPPLVTGADDARRAEWLPADTYGGFRSALYARYGGDVFAAHVAMLAEFLGPEVRS
jgi:8-oxo-dGTP pyrophosphatase MutT (NUDIX family)